MNILCVIAARGGSTGVPGKNIRPLLGKPVIAWAVEKALATPSITRVVVSTDSEEIARAGREAGADTPFMRPAELANSSAGKFQVWQHALAACECHYGESYDVFVDIDCTNPLIEQSDIQASIVLFLERRVHGVDGVFSVCSARRNPYFNIVEPDPSGALKVSKKIDGHMLCRQHAPKVYDHIAGVYALDPEYVRRAFYLLDGHVEGYELGEDKAFDIDCELDFTIIEFLLARKLKG